MVLFLKNYSRPLEEFLKSWVQFIENDPSLIPALSMGAGRSRTRYLAMALIDYQNQL
jgi:hypothetical protein